jgi:hypothetical protein
MSKNTERAKAIFAQYPNLSELHFTSDGSPFNSAIAAKNHAKTLEDKEVEILSREESGAEDTGENGNSEGGKEVKTKPLKKMNLEELTELATKLGVKVEEGATKKVIAEAIEAAQAASADDAGATATIVTTENPEGAGEGAAEGEKE